MAFSEFKTISEVQQRYGIRYVEAAFIHGDEQSPSPAFVADLAFAKEYIDIFASEASRSELIISPMLREVYKRHYRGLAFWIQKTIAYDGTLTGAPDYIISKRSSLGKTVLEMPIVIVVEAKRNDFDQGWGQCLAELVASQKLNGTPDKPVYGIVTDGNLWQCGRLAGDLFTRHAENFTIDRLARLYGALDYLVRLVEQDYGG